jgi:hypothetical protein
MLRAWASGYSACEGEDLSMSKRIESCSDSTVPVEALEQMMGRGGDRAGVFTCREDIDTSFGNTVSLATLDAGSWYHMMKVGEMTYLSTQKVNKAHRWSVRTRHFRDYASRSFLISPPRFYDTPATGAQCHPLSKTGARHVHI